MKRGDLCIVSACLVGLSTRYDGQTKTGADCLAALAGCSYVPACPEQLGGLATPREAADIVGGDGFDVLAGTAQVRTKSGDDVTRCFVAGAEQVLRIALAQDIRRACLKARSPSCAVSGTIGVTAALLRANGIELIEY